MVSLDVPAISAAFGNLPPGVPPAERSRNIKCGARGPRFPLKYFPRLYETVSSRKSDASEMVSPPASPEGLFVECLYESEKGQCQSLAREQIDSLESALSTEVDGSTSRSSSSSKTHAIIMIMFKRGRIMKRVLGDVSKQSVPSDVFIWNNNVSPKVRCKMMRVARKVASSAEGNGIRTLWMHQSPVNIGPPGSYALASTISNLYEKFIFIDDDCASPPDLVKTFIEESDEYPKDMISTWGKYAFTSVQCCFVCLKIYLNSAYIHS